MPTSLDNGIRHFRPGADFVTERGDAIPNVTVAYRTWGTLDEDGSNAVLVGHALTGTPDAASWWPGLIGAGSILDPARHFIVCANALGSCYGTTGPGTPDADGQRLGNRFPLVSVRDMAHLHALLLDHLGVTRLQLAIGGSLGGMQALELALTEAGSGRNRVQRLALIGMGARHDAWQIGISEAQRMAIRADARWRDGDFPADDPPADGLSAARALGMLTYRSPQQFADRFGRTRQREEPGSEFAIESYLRYQGRKLSDRFDAGSYVRLTEAMDGYDITAGRTPSALADFQGPTLCFGIRTDLLYPSEMSAELARLLPGGRYAELDSPFGHDAFLVDFEAMSGILYPFLAETGFYE